MTHTIQGEWLAKPATGPGVPGGRPVRVLLDDGREVVAALPKRLLRSAGLVMPGMRVEVSFHANTGQPHIVRFLMNRGPRSPFLRVSDWREGDRMRFIVIARIHTAVDLGTAKAWQDRFESDGTIDLFPPNALDAWPWGRDLLEPGGVTGRAEIVYPDGRPTEQLAPRPKPPPPPPCPTCAQPLKSLLECAHCGWLKFPGDYARWGTSGRCARCDFAYRWDGTRCSHCGHDATQTQRR
jgi:hypothetical protein